MNELVEQAIDESPTPQGIRTFILGGRPWFCSVDTCRFAGLEKGEAKSIIRQCLKKQTLALLGKEGKPGRKLVVIPAKDFDYIVSLGASLSAREYQWRKDAAKRRRWGEPAMAMAEFIKQADEKSVRDVQKFMAYWKPRWPPDIYAEADRRYQESLTRKGILDRLGLTSWRYNER